MTLPNATSARLLTQANRHLKIEKDYKNFLWQLEVAIVDGDKYEFRSSLNEYPDDLIDYLREKGYNVGCSETTRNVYQLKVWWR